ASSSTDDPSIGRERLPCKADARSKVIPRSTTFGGAILVALKKPGRKRTAVVAGDNESSQGAGLRRASRQRGGIRQVRPEIAEVAIFQVRKTIVFPPHA